MPDPKIIDLAPDETGAFSVDGHETRVAPKGPREPRGRKVQDEFLNEHMGEWVNPFRRSNIDSATPIDLLRQQAERARSTVDCGSATEQYLRREAEARARRF